MGSTDMTQAIADPVALMSASNGDDQEWDPSWPGTGAQRCTAITQLYFRLANYPSLTVLVVDALCLVFGESGATHSELEAYLGLSVDRVRFALACIPDDMRCTSRDLPSSGEAGSGAEEESEVAHFLNYKHLLPVAYAHVTRVLLALCRSPLPSTPSASQAGASVTVNLSRRLIREEASEGVLCRSCQFYYALADFQDSLALCPTCGDDVVTTTLKAIKEHMDAQCMQGNPLASPPRGGGVGSGTAGRPQKTSADAGASSPVSSPTAASPTVLAPSSAVAQRSARNRGAFGCPLARDPFLVQQALVFFHLFTVRFAFVVDDGPLVNPDDVLTEAEYSRQLQGRSSVADLFRAAHRNPASIRVKLLSQKAVDEARMLENQRKLAKRANLPPWLRRRTVGSLLSTHVADEPPMPLLDEKDDVRDGASEKTHPQTATVRDGDDTPAKRPREVARAVPTVKREARPLTSTGAVVGDAVLRDRAVATFIAKEFYHDDFDPVPLPRRRLQ